MKAVIPKTRTSLSHFSWNGIYEFYRLERHFGALSTVLINTDPTWGVLNNCQYFLSSRNMCTLRTVFCMWNLTLACFLHWNMVTCTLEGVIISLHVFKKTSSVDHAFLRWLWRSLMCKRQSCPPASSKTKFLKLITWSLKHIFFRNSVVRIIIKFKTYIYWFKWSITNNWLFGFFEGGSKNPTHKGEKERDVSTLGPRLSTENSSKHIQLIFATQNQD